MHILIVGLLHEDKWVGNLIRNIKTLDPYIHIDFFHAATVAGNYSSCKSLCQRVYYSKRHFPDFFYKIRILASFCQRIDVSISFKKFLKDKVRNDKSYDLVNFQYLMSATLRHWRFVQSVTSNTLLSPWGSDVLRLSRFGLFSLKNSVKHYNWVSITDNDDFRNLISDKLTIDKSRFVSLDFGSSMIDYIIDNNHITKHLAKEQMNLSGYYCIVCGYNASPAQNHMQILNSIMLAQPKIKEKICLLLPLTYAGSKTYKNEVIQYYKKSGINFKYFDSFLSVNELYCICRCADMFIHAQNTDANSACLAEYLLCGTTVVNAGWLSYENRERYGMPYVKFNNFEDLPIAIVEAYNNPPVLNDRLLDDIRKEGWRECARAWVNYLREVGKNNGNNR